MRFLRGGDRLPRLAAIPGLVCQLMRADGEAARFVHKMHFHQQLRRFGQLAPLAPRIDGPPDPFGRHHPAQLVIQEKLGVTIQPSLSFRKNSEIGTCLSLETVQCTPPSSVVTLTGFEPPFSSRYPAAMPRAGEGNCRSLITREEPSLS